MIKEDQGLRSFIKQEGAVDKVLAGTWHSKTKGSFLTQLAMDAVGKDIVIEVPSDETQIEVPNAVATYVP